MGAQPPFLYQSERYAEVYDGFPSTPFDPKAVTRASFQAKPPRPKPNGPLVDINRHPDAHEAPKQRSIYWKPMSGTTKWWIKATRVLQLGLRVLELVAATGVLVLFILMTNTGDLTAWVMRITAAVIIMSCIYAIYHLSRTARGRTPGSSAAYHSFAAITDLVVLPLYAYGALSVRNNGADWSTRLSSQQPMEYFLPATYYTLIGAGGAHLLSMIISLWLALMFRRIHKMPPDMNPLESHLTARAAHKRNKSSVTTTSTYADSVEKRYSAPLESHRRSGQPYEDTARPPTVPFMQTRQGSETSLRSSLRPRDSRADLPSRQYQIIPSNSPRHSGASELSLASKRTSGGGGGGPHSPAKLTSSRNSYVEVPLHDDRGSPSSRPTTGSSAARPGTTSSYRSSYTSPTTTTPTPPRHSTATPNGHAAAAAREPRFTETWYASESLVSRTQARAARDQARSRALDQLTANNSKAATDTKTDKRYAPLEQRYDTDSDSDYGSSENDAADLSSSATTPHPLRSHPTSPRGPGAGAPDSRLRLAPITASTLNRRASPLAELLPPAASDATDDIADQRPVAGDRKSSIQAEAAFCAKPYGALGTAPGGGGVGEGRRQVSSGNDYGLQPGGGFGGRFSVFGRRRGVSGKVVEEGRGGVQ